MEVEWQQLKAHELNELVAQNAAVIVPLASIEQHGPHLPTMTDTKIGHEVAYRAAQKAHAVRPVIVTPVVWSGLSEHHMTFGGTITIEPDTFIALVSDIVTAITRHGFKNILLSNSHGGNKVAMQHIADRLSMRLDATIVATSYISEAEAAIAALLDDQPGIHHACEAETSMMMAMAPDLVDEAILGDIATPIDRPFLTAGKASYRWRPFTEVTQNGLLGNPRSANADKGEALLEAASDALAALLTDDGLWTR
ncbi:MAG: creatininase family protein [Pseudomonadota bacterium]